MKKAYVFPGQGAQFVGMGKDLYDSSEDAKALFEKANKILGFNITEIMFSGTDEALKQTNVTHPAIFLHSVILAKALGDSFQPDMAAGHSLGEFSALVACGAMSWTPLSHVATLVHPPHFTPSIHATIELACTEATTRCV